jgi:hypothetical protein
MVMQEEHKDLYRFRLSVPYVQCERGVLYYLTPEVLVVGVTSTVRERELIPGLGLL